MISSEGYGVVVDVAWIGRPDIVFDFGIGWKIVASIAAINGFHDFHLVEHESDAPLPFLLVVSRQHVEFNTTNTAAPET